MNEEERRRLVFQDRKTRDAFWHDIREVIDRYPSIIDNLDAMLEGDEDGEGIPYDSASPKLIDGLVLIISIRNLDGWESSCTLDPYEQSAYMTQGLLNASYYMGE